MSSRLDAAARFAGVPSAVVYDAGGRRHALDRAIKPLAAGVRVAGPAYTVRCAAGDNLALHRAMARVEAGWILVVATSGGHDDSYCGALLCAAAAARGVAAIVLDGWVRDVDELAAGPVPVLCRGAAHVGAVKVDAGELEIAVTCGGRVVEHGQVVVGDGDGVVTVPLADEEATLERAEALVAREARVRAEILTGRSTVDIFQLAKGDPDA